MQDRERALGAAFRANHRTSRAPRGEHHRHAHRSAEGEAAQPIRNQAIQQELTLPTVHQSEVLHVVRFVLFVLLCVVFCFVFVISLFRFVVVGRCC